MNEDPATLSGDSPAPEIAAPNLGTLLEHFLAARDSHELVAASVEYERVLLRADAPAADDVPLLLHLAGVLGYGHDRVRHDIAGALRNLAFQAARPWFDLVRSAAASIAAPDNDDGQRARRVFLASRGWKESGEAWIPPGGKKSDSISTSDAVRAELSADVSRVAPFTE